MQPDQAATPVAPFALNARVRITAHHTDYVGQVVRVRQRALLTRVVDDRIVGTVEAFEVTSPAIPSLWIGAEQAEVVTEPHHQEGRNRAP